MYCPTSSMYGAAFVVAIKSWFTLPVGEPHTAKLTGIPFPAGCRDTTWHDSGILHFSGWKDGQSMSTWLWYLHACICAICAPAKEIEKAPHQPGNSMKTPYETMCSVMCIYKYNPGHHDVINHSMQILVLRANFIFIIFNYLQRIGTSHPSLHWTLPGQSAVCHHCLPGKSGIQMR